MTAPHFSLIGSGHSVAIYRGAERVSRFYQHRDAATARMNALEAISLITARPCLCCGARFNSTGKGHRLCSTCRAAA